MSNKSTGQQVFINVQANVEIKVELYAEKDRDIVVLLLINV